MHQQIGKLCITFFISAFILVLFIFLRCRILLLKREVRHLQIPFLYQYLKAGKKVFFLYLHCQRELLIDCRRIENTQEPAYNDLVHFCRRRGQTCQIVQSLSRWNDGIMIRDLLIIHVTCLRNILIGPLL